MIKLQVDVMQKDSKGEVVAVQKIPMESTASILRLNPAAVLAAAPGLASKAITVHGIHANIDCDKAVLHVEGFKYVSLAAFLNREPSIALLHITGCSEYFKLSNLSVRRLDSGESSMVLSGCSVAELNVGLSTVYRLQKEGKSTQDLEPLKSDVRNSSVQSFRIFVPHSMVHVQGSTVQRLALERDSLKADQIDVRDNSVVERLVLSGLVGKLKVKTSKVADLEFSPEARLGELDMKGAYINGAHNCHPETIVKKSIDSWKLVMDCAKASNSPSLYAQAGFEYMKFERKQLSGFFHRAAYRFIELACGYGFRPSYTVLSAVLVCLGCGFGFFWLTVDFQAGIRITDQAKLDWLETLGFSMYYSVITFTTVGYGDISPVGPLARVLACFEALSGISLSALFIFALTKRYGGLR